MMTEYEAAPTEAAVPAEPVPAAQNGLDATAAEEAIAQALHDRARLEELFSGVPGNQKVFLETMEYCREPRTPIELDAFMQRILATNRSVYSPVELRAAMQRHLALAYVPSEEELAAHGRLVGEGEIDENEPVEVDEEGFLVIRVPEPGTWTLTPTACAWLDEDPLGRYADELFEVREPQYKRIYAIMLERLGSGNASRQDLAALVEHLPECREPRMYIGHFLGELEHADAITWAGDAWQITERGRTALSRLQKEGE